MKKQQRYSVAMSSEWHRSSVISQKGEFQNGCYKKKEQVQLSEKQILFPTPYKHMYLFISGGKNNVRSSENMACFVFLLPSSWDLPLFFLITDAFWCLQSLLRTKCNVVSCCHWYWWIIFVQRTINWWMTNSFF